MTSYSCHERLERAEERASRAVGYLEELTEELDRAKDALHQPADRVPDLTAEAVAGLRLLRLDGWPHGVTPPEVRAAYEWIGRL